MVGPGPRGLSTILSAVANASTIPASRDIVLRILQGGAGHPSHLRALFGDVDAATLDRVAAAAGIATETWLAAYGAARVSAGAANPELDGLLGDVIGFTGPDPT